MREHHLAGRRAVTRWLREPSAPPQFESEALVRALFAPSGSKDDLLAAIRSLRDYAEALPEEQVETWADTADPEVFPTAREVIIRCLLQEEPSP